MAKSLTAEQDIHKLQVINLAVKLYLTKPKQTKLLTHYMLNLSKSHQNCDICNLSPGSLSSLQRWSPPSHHAKKLFLALKPAPGLESSFKDQTTSSRTHYPTH